MIHVDPKEKKKEEKEEEEEKSTAPCLVEGARIKADSQRAWSLLGDHPERDGSRYRDIVSIFPPWPETHTHTHTHGAGCRKKQGNFRKETREIDSRAGFERVAGTCHSLSLSLSFSLSLSVSPYVSRRKVTSGSGRGRIGKVEIASMKLLSRNGLP